GDRRRTCARPPSRRPCREFRRERQPHAELRGAARPRPGRGAGRARRRQGAVLHPCRLPRRPADRRGPRRRRPGRRPTGGVRPIAPVAARDGPRLQHNPL
ncbi:MAG: hypothetical protein AVDCRST_MAG04-1669, partial [uncultured Acetobacteraceae bacterium]